MGTRTVYVTAPFASLSSAEQIPRTLKSVHPLKRIHRCCCTSNGSRKGAKDNWDSNAEFTVGSNHFNSNLGHEVFADYEDYDNDFRFGSSTRIKRKWWSECNSFDFEDDDGDDIEFPLLENSIGGFALISKVFRAFGWMVPAIFISMLLGTGPNAFFMALALPLAQSGLGLIIETFWSRPDDIPRSNPRTRRRPVARAPSKAETSKEKRTTSANLDYGEKGERNASSFGGWDELDRDRSETSPSTAYTRTTNKQVLQKKGKLSKVIRKREKPLIVRLLVAIFPFLGSWTKLL